MKISKKFPALQTGVVSGLATHGVSFLAGAPFEVCAGLGLVTGTLAGLSARGMYSLAKLEITEIIMRERKGLREQIGREAFRELDIEDKTERVRVRKPAERIRSKARDMAYGTAILVTLFSSTAGIIAGRHHRQEMKKEMGAKPDTLQKPQRF